MDIKVTSYYYGDNIEDSEEGTVFFLNEGSNLGSVYAGDAG